MKEKKEYYHIFQYFYTLTILTIHTWITNTFVYIHLATDSSPAGFTNTLKGKQLINTNAIDTWISTT